MRPNVKRYCACTLRNGSGVAESKRRQLARDTEGYSGADLESVVKDAIEQAFVECKGDLTLEHLLRSAKDTVPMARVMKDKMKEYDRKFEELGIKSASESDVELIPPVGECPSYITARSP